MWTVSSKRNDQVCQRFDLKQQQFAVLNEIVWYGPISQKELGETLLFEKSNVPKIVKILSEKKWISVAVAAQDRRLMLLTETPAGFAVWKESMQAVYQSSLELASILSDSGQAKAIRLLNKLAKAFKGK
jgi:DNA-binding MarR family transcriptional regulator